MRVPPCTLRHGFCAVLCLAGLLLAPSSSVHATIMREMSVEELSTVSAHVVRGTVLGQVSRWSDDGKGILTYVDVAVHERVKGKRPLPDVIQIVQPGGELDGVRMAIVGWPAFREGEDLFLFLGDHSDNPAEADLVVLIGGKMGRMPVITDPDTGEARVVRQFTGLEFARFVEDRGKPQFEITPGPPDSTIPIQEFRRRVLEAGTPPAKGRDPAGRNGDGGDRP